MVSAAVPLMIRCELPVISADAVVPPTKFLQMLKLALSVSCALSLIVALPIDTADDMTGSLTVFGIVTLCVHPFGPPAGDVGLQFVGVAQSVLVAPVQV